MRSPIAGRVSRAEVTEGNLVQAGPPDATLLTTVVSLDSMYLYFDSDEQTYLRYSGRAADRPATGAGTTRGSRSTSAWPTRPASRTRGGWTSSTTGSTPPAAPSARARSSPTATAGSRRGCSPGSSWWATSETPTLLVRDAAVGTDQDRKFVLVLGKGDSLEYRPVEIGRLTDGLRIVRKGVAGRRKVVVNGLMRVRPGMKVTPKLVAMVPDSSGASDSPWRDSSGATVAER